MDKDQRISPGALTGFAFSALRTLGAEEKAARTTAEVFVGADLRGISSHGVAGGTGLIETIERVRASAININAQPEVNRKENGALATMDAKGGLGPSAAMDATHLAGDIADELGYGKVYVRDANHFGATCVYVEALTARGFAGRATCTSGAWMIPFGGDRIRLGTNPITWGVPCGDQPIVIDIAMTQRAVSPALRAAKAGEPLPPDYFIDEKMNPLEGIVSLETLFRGSVRPLGGERFGYKGSGLAILVEMDAVIGGGSTERIPSMRERPLSRVSQTFEAWRLDFLMPEADARRKIEEAAADIRRHGAPGMLLPGEREARRKAEAEAEGIPYDPDQWEALRRIAEETGAKTPDPV